MDITDLIATEQGSRALEALSRRFNLTPDQTRAAIDQLAPAVMSGMRNETASPQGVQGLLGALVKGDHGRYLDGDEAGMVDDGNGILAHIFGSKDVSRGVAAEAARETGLGDDTMKQMLPMVASLVMGALGKNLMGDQASTKGGGLGDMLGQMLGGAGGSGGSGDLGGMLGQMLGGAGGSGSSGDLGAMLGQVLGGGSAGGGSPAGGGSLGDLLGGLGGGIGGGSPSQGASLDDVLGAVFGTAAPPDVRAGVTERARTSLGATLGANTPKGDKGTRC
jgi:hypothetical protein